MNVETAKRKYEILNIKDGSWVFLKCDENDLDEPDAFAEFLERAQKFLGGKIIDLGDMRYRIEGDRLNLIFQWDSCFGIVVEIPSAASYVKGIRFLKIICD